MNWTPVSAEALFAAMDATWPARSYSAIGPWIVREGCDGGQRVSAATASRAVSKNDIPLAERAMDDLGQTRIFAIRDVNDPLDSLLEQRGYVVKDPVDLFAAPSEKIAAFDPHSIDAIFCESHFSIMEEVWAKGGIGAGRLAVMDRAPEPKTFLLGRYDARATGAGFVSCYKGIAMLHALEVLPHIRRSGLGLKMTGAAAAWAVRNQAQVFALVATSDNLPAQRLYRKMGMEVFGHYHYRIATPKTETKHVT